MYIAPPKTLPLRHILPEAPSLAMGATLTPLSTTVAEAGCRSMDGQGLQLARVMNSVREMAGYLFQTTSPYVLGLTGPTSVGVETAISNLIEPGESVLCLRNGFFGDRLTEIVKRAGGQAQVLTAEGSFDIEKVRTQLKNGAFKALTLVHGEASRSVLNSNLREIAEVANEHGVLIIVDATYTLSTQPVPVDHWQLDAVCTSAEKGMSSASGFSLVSFSQRAWSKIENRKKATAPWGLDALRVYDFWLKKHYHSNTTVFSLLTAYEALRLVCEETLPNRFKRHYQCSTALQSGLEAAGLSLFSSPTQRLNSVIGVRLPEGISPEFVLQHMSHCHRVEISPGINQSMLCIGQMGEQCRDYNISRTLRALCTSLTVTGMEIDLPTALAELERCIHHSEPAACASG